MSATDTLRATLPTTPSSGIRMLARFGFAAKGIVYGLMGLLALLAATGQQNGQTADKQKAVHTLQELPGGPVLLGVLLLRLRRTGRMGAGQPDRQEASPLLAERRCARSITSFWPYP